VGHDTCGGPFSFGGAMRRWKQGLLVGTLVAAGLLLSWDPAARAAGYAITEAILQGRDWALSALKPFTVKQDFTMTDPTIAPTASSFVSGSCAGEVRFAVYAGNQSGLTARGPASISYFPSGSKNFIVTKGALPSGANTWGALWANASDGFTAWKTCNNSSTLESSLVSSGIGTFTCGCGTGEVAGSNTTGKRSVATITTDGLMTFAAYDQSNVRRTFQEAMRRLDLLPSGNPPYPRISLDGAATWGGLYMFTGTEIHVGKSGYQFSTVGGALAAITALGDASATKRYVIVVHPGDYDEILAGIGYVSIMGVDRQTTRVHSINGISEAGIANITFGHIGNGVQADAGIAYVTNSNIGIIDGSAPWGNSDRPVSGGWATTSSAANYYRGTVTAFEAQNKTKLLSRGDQFEVDCKATSGGQFAGPDDPWCVAVVRDEAEPNVVIEGAIIKVSSTQTGDPIAGWGCFAGPILGPGSTPTSFRIAHSRIEVTTTNASRNAAASCAVVPDAGCAESGALALSLELNDVDCVVNVADSASTLRGLFFTSAPDHANWTTKWRGGSISLAGGATRWDVENQETTGSAFAELTGVISSGAFTGAGKTTVNDANFTPRASIAGAATVTLMGEGTYTITGTANITSITAAANGTKVTLLFTGTAAGTGLTDGSNLKLAGNFVYTPDDTTRLVCDGTNWYEAGRSVN